MKIDITRSKRRTLSLQIKNYDELIIKAPLKMSDEKINAFIKQKEGWINKAMARLKAQSDFKNTFDFENYIYLLGQRQELTNFDLLGSFQKTYCPRKSKSDAISTEMSKTNAAEKSLPNKSFPNEKLYKKFANDYLPKKAREISEQVGLDFKELKVNTSKRCWGSYSRDRKMKLNWKLVILPEALITYVIVHELCHSKELNHSPKFWKLVESALPNYKTLKKSLNNYGFLL